jgi:hypothetical protein
LPIKLTKKDKSLYHWKIKDKKLKKVKSGVKGGIKIGFEKCKYFSKRKNIRIR